MQLSGIFLFVLFLFSSLCSGNTTEKISLAQAIRSGLVTAVFSGRKPDTSNPAASRYYGPCIALTLKSKHRQKLDLILESGRFLQPDDTLEQRMMVTREQLISLDPGRSRSLNVYAMCTQMHHQSPGSGTLLSPGSLADGNLLTLALFISRNNLQGSAGQQAVWVLTDENEISNIYGEEKGAKQLLEFVAKLTGKPIPKSPQVMLYSDGEISGEINFENKVPDFFSMYLVNGVNEKLMTYFENQEVSRPTRNTLKWRFRYKGFPKGVYFIRVINKAQQVIVIRPVIIN
jgi:hypothetical protein